MSRSRIGRALMTTAGGAAVGQAVVLFTAPILARYYGPEAFGLYGVFTAVAAIVSAFVVLRLDVALLAAEDETTAKQLAWAGLGAVFVGACLLAAIGLLATWVGRASISPSILLLGVGTVIVLGSAQIANAWMVRFRRYSALAVRSLLQGVLQSGVQILGGLLGIGSGLLLGLGAGRLAALGGLTAGWGLLRAPRPTARQCVGALNRFRRYPLVSSWSGLMNSAGLQAPMLIVASQYGAVAAGLLTLTTRVLAAPVGLLGTATASVFQGELIRRRSSEPAQLLRKTMLGLLAVGTVPAILLIALAPPSFALLFGEDWRSAGTLAQVLAPAYLAQFVIVPVSQTLLIFQKNGMQLAWDSSRLALVTISPLLVVASGGTLTMAIGAIATGQTVAYIALAWLSIKAAHDSPSTPASIKEI